MKIEEQRIPASLEICPIVGSVVEVRFTSNLVRQAIFGIAYDRLKEKFSKVEDLPLLQFPQAVIDREPNFKYKPHYKLSGNGFDVQFGPDVLTVSPEMPYPGWRRFYPEIEEIFNLLFTTGIIDTVLRLGIRYTNFFHQTDIFRNLNLKIQYNNASIPYRKTILRTELPFGSFNNTLQVSNNASRENPPGGRKDIGSLIDIDTYKEYAAPGAKLSEVLHDVGNGHQVEKKIFWDLLDDALKKELKPTY